MKKNKFNQRTLRTYQKHYHRKRHQYLESGIYGESFLEWYRNKFPKKYKYLKEHGT